MKACLVDACLYRGEHRRGFEPVKRDLRAHRRSVNDNRRRDRHRREHMRELLRTNDIVFLSWVVAAMRAEGLEPIIFDNHTSIVEGSIGAIPRRLMIDDEGYERARDLLEQLQADDA